MNVEQHAAVTRVASRRGTAVRPYDVGALREQFPILSRTMRGHPLAYLDNASTTQKPQRVIDATSRFYETTNANIHRGVYELSEQATDVYVRAHAVVAEFVGAERPEDVVFVRNATEGINLIAGAWGITRVAPGSRILLTAMEHHSNVVPWQRLARARGASLQYVELTPEGRLDLDDLSAKLAAHPALLTLTHVSNVLGAVNPITEIAALARAAGVPVVVDAAQSVGRLPVDVRDWDADFVVFSGHKMYGPTGTGVVVGKREHFESMEPFLTGGDMVKTVTREQATWNDLPWKFEAGTPHVAGGVGLAEAVGFLSDTGMGRVWEHEQDLVRHALPKLLALHGVTLLGPARETNRVGIFSFTVDGVHSHDLASFLDARGIAIRGGHHCAQPLLQTFGLQECARVSVGVYTTLEEIDRLVDAVDEARDVLT